jgi:predicted TIM-barrel fold metal-dependent hydrolase
MSERPAVPPNLPLSQFVPRPTLVTPAHQVARARVSAIDVHNHLGRWLTKDGQWSVRDVPALLGVMDYCHLSAIVNLDGMWGDELEANLDRYDRAHPGRFFTFAHCDWNLVTEADFGPRMARQLADSVRRGARGLKVWKTLGLHYRDGAGKLIPIDDPRLFDLWEAAGEAAVPVLIHIADPVAFFQPLDHTNERWEELHAHPDWHFPSPAFPAFETLIEQFEHLIAEHPRTTFIGAHVGCYAENLSWVGRMLDTYANFHVDISARLAELGRQPYAARRFFTRYAGRIAFGLDSYPPTAQAYAPYFRFLETADEYFPYSPTEPGRQGRWRIYGIDLPDEVLRQVYHDTAAHVLGLATP